MMEILFSDSACGSLKMAQHYGKGKYRSGCIGVVISHSDGSKPTKAEVKAAQQEAEERERLAWESATPLGGNTADIFGFNLALSIGDISEDQLGIQRKQTLEHLYSVYPNNEGYQAVQKILKRTNENLTTIQERTSTGEPLRIWYSNQPDEMCGLYWFVGQLNQWNVHSEQVSIVKLPELEFDEKGNVVQKIGWGEVRPGEWHRYLALERPALPKFMQSCASHWQELQGENAPLRAILNGQLVSVSENLYDSFILREISEEGEEFNEAVVIGRVLGKYRLGIGDAFLAFRIEEMIHAGKLETVSDIAENMPSYNRVLKSCTP